MEIANLRQNDYNAGWIGCLLAFLCLAGGGSWLAFGLAPPTESAQRTDARVTLLMVGLGLGAVAMLAGLVFFYRWSESLTKWLDTSDDRELRWVLIPVLMMVLGAGLAFLAIQPARAEERNNSRVRRVVYGANFGLTVLLTVVVLVVFNVVVTAKVSNRLDATETGFYELSGPTKELLARLEEPVNAYAVLPEGSGREPGLRLANDIRQLLLACEEASGGKFKVRFYSLTNQRALAELRAKSSQLDITLKREDVGGAVLLTTGPDERRQAVLRDEEFLAPGGQGADPAFLGEPRLFQEVAFLADNQVRPVVYFTQSNRELSILGGPDTPATRTATRLKAYLEKNYLTVKPLLLPDPNPSVPEDASVVVVADPQLPFSEAAAGALRKYSSTRQKDGQKGKLVILAGTTAGPEGKVMPTGLEGLLGELGVSLGNQFVFNLPTDNSPSPRVVLSGFNPSDSAARNPVIAAMSQSTGGFFGLPTPREVFAVGKPELDVQDLILTAGITWVEDTYPTNIQETMQLMLKNPTVQRQKLLTNENRTLGVVVTQRPDPRAPAGSPEGKAEPRAVVIGNGTLVSDGIGDRRSSDPFTFALVGVSIDWLRSRPAFAATGVAAKKYRAYTFPHPDKVSSTRLEYLPLGLTFLVVVGLGTGVWAVRRR